MVTDKPTISKQNPGRTFEVMAQKLGKRKRGQTFTEYDFRNENPPGSMLDFDIPEEQLYNKLIEYHLSLNPPTFRLVQ
jgi:hypothetical protein